MIEAQLKLSGPFLMPVIFMVLILMVGVGLGYFAFSKFYSPVLGAVGTTAAIATAVMACFLYEGVLDHRYPMDTSEVEAGLVQLGLTQDETEASLDKIRDAKNGEAMVLYDKVVVFNDREGELKLVPYDGTLDD